MPPCRPPPQVSYGLELTEVAESPQHLLPPPATLTDLLSTARGEEHILQLLKTRRPLEEFRTAAPWAINNQHSYVEKATLPHVSSPLHIATEKGFSRVAAQVITCGGRADVVDSTGRTALMVGAKCGNPEVVRTLLASRASADAKDHSGKQALHYAMNTAAGASEVVRLLVHARANLDARDAQGITPLMIGAAVDAGPAVEELLKHGAARTGFDKAGRTPRDHASTTFRRSPKLHMADLDPSDSLFDTRRVDTGGHSAEQTRWFTGSLKHPCCRWDNIGDTAMQQRLLREERIWRRRAVPCLGVAERDRLNAAMPQLS